MSKVLLLPTGDLYDELFPPQVIDLLHSYADVKHNHKGDQLSEIDLADLAQDVNGVLTSWGSPQFTESIVKACPNLRFIGHAAGSIKPIVTKEVFDHVTVSSSAGIIAKFVAEAVLLSILAALRNTTLNDQDMKQGNWRSANYHIHDSLFGQTIGLVGLGMTARESLKLLAPFACKVYAYDPYISSAEADRLGVERMDLDNLLQTCPIISLHAAATPETTHLINADRLRLVRDGAVLVNTARGALIDEEALLSEVADGRFQVVLDVFATEPLEVDSPLRTWKHAILSPHIAGPAYLRRWEMGYAMAEDCRRVLIGEAPLHAVSASQLDTGA